MQRKPGALRNGAPFLDLPAPLQRLRKSLLRLPGGDRTMAQVLASLPQAGLEAVLVAVDLVLEGATPTGSVSAEHVRNVLARLNAPPTPEHAQTALQLSHLPMADTARYDRLRPTHTRLDQDMFNAMLLRSSHECPESKSRSVVSSDVFGLAPKHSDPVEQAGDVMPANAKVCCYIYAFMAEVIGHGEVFEAP